MSRFSSTKSNIFRPWKLAGSLRSGGRDGRNGGAMRVLDELKLAASYLKNV